MAAAEQQVFCRKIIGERVLLMLPLNVVLAWTLDTEETAQLVEQSRTETVTVNSALAVSTRDKLNVPVGDALGFYASSLTVKLPYCSTMAFWDNARAVQAKITKELAKTDLLRSRPCKARCSTLTSKKRCSVS